LNKIKKFLFFPLCVAATGLPVLQYLTLTLSFPAILEYTGRRRREGQTYCILPSQPHWRKYDATVVRETLQL